VEIRYGLCPLCDASCGLRFEVDGERLAGIQAEHGRDATGLYYGNPTGHDYKAMVAVGAWLQLLGSRNVFSSNSVDAHPRMLVSLQLYGNQALLPVPDIERTDLLVVQGANPVVSHGSVMTAPDTKKRLRAIRERGGRIVVIDPRRTETATIADRHLAVRPGTDGLLLLSVIHELARQDLLDERARRIAAGVDELLELAAAFPPERTAARTGVAAEDVRWLAGEFGRADRAAWHGRMGVSTQSFGCLSTWLIDAIVALTGNLDRPGGLMFPTPAVDLAGLVRAIGQTGDFGRWTSRTGGLPEFNGELPVAALADEIEQPGPGQLRDLLLFGGDPALSNPNGRRVERALERLDFLACVDPYLNETTRLADVIIPPAGHLEGASYPALELTMGVRDVARYARPVVPPEPGRADDFGILVEILRSLLRARGRAARLSAARHLTGRLHHRPRRGDDADDAGHREPALRLGARPSGHPPVGGLPAARREHERRHRRAALRRRVGLLGARRDPGPDRVDLMRCVPVLAALTLAACPTPELEPWPADPSLETSRPELWRPQLHFSPQQGWMNDPVGLVHFQDEWHLFFQHDPDSEVWGAMHWGHAVSADLVHWEELPIALLPDEHGAAFSGSAVVDADDSSGLCGGEPCLVALFTRDGDQQTQHLAWSTDAGRSWQLLDEPVIGNPGLADFRDPKVLRWQDAWRMVLAAGDRILVYGSTDLRSWSALGDFDPGLGGTLECPDLFELPVAGTGETRWVLQLDVLTGGPQGGSGGGWFVGSFDGEAFVPEHDEPRWLDHGADLYASQTWSDAPDGRRLLLGWMSNWRYALLTPTSPWRGAQSLPRQLSLGEDGDRVVLVQRPVPELEVLRTGAVRSAIDLELTYDLPFGEVTGRALEIELELEPGEAGAVGIRVLHGETGTTEIGWDGQLYLDRSASGTIDFHDAFPARHDAPVTLRDGRLDLRVFVDHSSVEVFADGGRVVLTDRVFPGFDDAGLALFVRDGPAVVRSLEVHALESIWRP